MLARSFWWMSGQWRLLGYRRRSKEFLRLLANSQVRWNNLWNFELILINSADSSSTCSTLWCARTESSRKFLKSLVQIFSTKASLSSKKCTECRNSKTYSWNKFFFAPTLVMVNSTTTNGFKSCCHGRCLQAASLMTALTARATWTVLELLTWRFLQEFWILRTLIIKTFYKLKEQGIYHQWRHGWLKF